MVLSSPVFLGAVFQCPVILVPAKNLSQLFLGADFFPVMMSDLFFRDRHRRSTTCQLHFFLLTFFLCFFVFFNLTVPMCSVWASSLLSGTCFFAFLGSSPALDLSLRECY